MCSDHNLRVNPPLEGSHCPNLYAGARYSFIYIEIYSCWENTYIEGVKDCLVETATKGIWGFIMPLLMKLLMFQMMRIMYYITKFT